MVSLENKIIDLFCRFVSRSFSGFLIVWIGFDRTAAVASALQCGVVLATLLYFVLCECSVKSNRAAVHWNEVTIVEDKGRISHCCRENSKQHFL